MVIIAKKNRALIVFLGEKQNKREKVNNTHSRRKKKKKKNINAHMNITII